MEGVNVLYMYYDKTPIFALWILLAVSTFSVIIAALSAERFKISLIAFAVFGVFVWFACWETTSPFQQKFKVTVDGSLSYQEFVDKYDVIANEGKIYTITVKDEAK
jgi:hypothetical protein